MIADDELRAVLRESAEGAVDDDVAWDQLGGTLRRRARRQAVLVAAAVLAVIGLTGGVLANRGGGKPDRVGTTNEPVETTTTVATTTTTAPTTAAGAPTTVVAATHPAAFYATDDNRLVRVSAETGEEEAVLYESGGYLGDVAVAPGGTIAVAEWTAGACARQLVEVAPDGSVSKRGEGATPAYSSDGRKLAYTVMYTETDFGCGSNAIVIHDLVTGEDQLIVSSDPEAVLPGISSIDWSPDGTHLLFGRAHEAEADYLLDVTGVADLAHAIAFPADDFTTSRSVYRPDGRVARRGPCCLEFSEDPTRATWSAFDVVRDNPPEPMPELGDDVIAIAIDRETGAIIATTQVEGIGDRTVRRIDADGTITPLAGAWIYVAW